MTQLRLGTAAGRATLATTVLASGMAFLASTVVIIALPDLGEQLRVNLSGLQWIIIGYTLVLAAFALLGGALGEQHGRRRIFLAGVAWFTIASIACGLAPSLDLLTMARVLQGAGAALMVPGSLAILQASFVPSDRAAAIGAWSGVSGISVVLGPLLGGWLVGVFGWRAVFLLNVPLAVVVLLLGVRYPPESSNPAARHTRSDLAGPLFGALGLAGLTYALVSTPKDGLGSFRVWLGFAVGLLGPISLALVERGRRRPGVGISDREGRPRIMAMIPPGQLASRTFALLTLYTFSVYAALGGLVFFLVIQLQTVAGYSATAVGAASLPTTLIILAGGLGGAALAARIGWRARLIAGPALCAAGTLLLLNVGLDTVYWRDVLPGTILLGLGLAAFAAPLTSAMLAAVARIGQLLAVAALPLLVGLGGAAYANPTAFNHGYHVALWWCAGFLTAGALTALLLRTSEISG